MNKKTKCLLIFIPCVLLHTSFGHGSLNAASLSESSSKNAFRQDLSEKGVFEYQFVSEIDDSLDDDEDQAAEFTKYDILISPGKKTIKTNTSFKIRIIPNDTDDFSDEEWKEICSKQIDLVTYRSTKPRIASVNKNGKVTGRKKGTAAIKTSIYLSNGEMAAFKTKVIVKEENVKK